MRTTRPVSMTLVDERFAPKHCAKRRVHRSGSVLAAQEARFRTTFVQMAKHRRFT
jgi:hypothetical protein